MSPVTVTELRERELEVAETRVGIDEARNGRGQLLVVQAAAGLGKTSLLATARATNRRLDQQTHRRTGWRSLISRRHRLIRLDRLRPTDRLMAALHLAVLVG